MSSLSQQGQQIVQDLAQRYATSPDAVTTLLYAVANGNGTMAQFSHPELGGSGQWMMGGMTMVGDMFNHGLKSRVDGLCSELSNALAAPTRLFMPVETPQGGNFGTTGFSSWWPAELGSPSASGGQNDVRYAVFPGTRRLAIEHGGTTTVYDTLDHQIGGVSQQQGGFGSLTFSSQYGTVMLSNLPVISSNGFIPAPPPPAPPASSPAPFFQPQPDYAPPPANGTEADVFAKIEKLADLRQRGILSDEEFSAKKAELLSRI